MDLIITQQTGMFMLMFIVLALLGIRSFFDWYHKYKYYDKFVHFLFGVVLTIFMIGNNFTIQTIIIVNLMAGIGWEYFQIKIQKDIKWRIIGFKEGWGDVAIHVGGTIAYLIFRGLLW